MFANRNVYKLSNVVNISYVINNKTSVNMRTRHYWSGAVNKDYYLLQNDGSLAGHSEYAENKDLNYNALNVDLNFRWVFAPGSELCLAWKCASVSTKNDVNKNYWSNLKNSINEQANSLSVKVLYYIDSNRLFKSKS